MAIKVKTCGVKREKGYLYYIDKDGDVSRTKVGRRSEESKAIVEKVSTVALKKEKGFLYFLDKEGDVAKTSMSRGRK